MMKSFLHGIVLAFALILPPGTQNIFVFNQGAIQGNLLYALPVAVTAAISDTILILLAVMGVSTVVLTLPWVNTMLMVMGVFFLSYIGWISWHSNESTNHEFNNAQNWSLRKKILFTLSVSLFNPHAILDTIGVIGTSSLSYTGEAKVAFAIACGLVSWSWFLMLMLAGSLIGISKYLFHLLNKVSAVIMWISAVYLVKNLI